MSKVKVNQSNLNSAYYKRISIGYCSAQFLLHFSEPAYYTCGTYGWNANHYIINDNVLISTGYRPKGNIETYGLARKYDDKARKIYCSDLSYDQKKKKINKLLDKFVKDVLEKYEMENNVK